MRWFLGYLTVIIVPISVYFGRSPCEEENKICESKTLVKILKGKRLEYYPSHAMKQTPTRTLDNDLQDEISVLKANDSERLI